ncbi:MAG: medium chain dehydrogenase/reductase family protein [Actinomycetota bacterium]|nr:medium chain dehydrogenase/reductase family protein [Actinomycetota bacterium]
MKAVVITKNGGPDVLEVQERPDPPVGPGQVRVAVKAAGINFADLMARSGVYPDAPPLPSIVGYEAAGEVESLGDGVEGLKVGDRVIVGTRFGGYAEMISVDQGQVLPLPDSLSFEQGAAVVVNYATAYAGLVMMGGLRAGDRMLIHSAAGGVGIAAIQIGTQVGAEIYGTASAGKHDAIRAEGCKHPIDYRTVDFADEIMRLTNGEGVDVVMDAIGPTSFRRSYRVLRQGGRLIMFGLAEVQTGDGRNIPALVKSLVRMPGATMPWWKSLAMMSENKGVFGLNMLSWWDREGLDRLLPPLQDGLGSGALVPVVAESFSFDNAPDAHRFLADAKNVGKVVLTP